MATFPAACAASNHRPRPRVAPNAAHVCGRNDSHSQMSISALNASPRAPQKSANGTRRRINLAAPAPAAPHAPQASICHGVQSPWPRNRFEVNAASIPTAIPARAPSAAPAATAITVTGCTPGTAAKRTRPAAAAPASVAITASSRAESGPASSQAAPATTKAAATSSSASPAFAGAAAAQTAAANAAPAAARAIVLGMGALAHREHVERDDALGDLRRPRQVVRDDERGAPRRLRAEEPRELRLPLRVHAARRLVEDEPLG